MAGDQVQQHVGTATHDLALLVASHEPLAQSSKAQRMDVFFLPFSKDQGGETLGQVGLFP